jgi:2-dehydro-3-deoxygluconokinase
MTMREQSSSGEQTYQGFLSDKNKIYTSPAFTLSSVVERIGTGDAFMAGLLYGIRQDWVNQRIIDFATAAGVYKHTIPGDVNIAYKDDIEQLINQNGTGRIIR